MQSDSGGSDGRVGPSAGQAKSAAWHALLDELSAAVTPGTHAVVLMDRAGWHVARELDIPAN